MPGDDQLDEIFVDEEDFDTGVIAEVIGQFGRITEPSGDFLPIEQYHNLSEGDKVLVGLLAHQAKYLRDLVDEPAIGPSAISDFTGVNLNTVKGNLRDLDEEGLVTNEEGKYQIPTVQVGRVRQQLEDDG